MIRWGKLRDLVEDPLDKVLTVLKEVRDNFLEYIIEQKKNAQLNSNPSTPASRTPSAPVSRKGSPLGRHKIIAEDDDMANSTGTSTSRAKSTKGTQRTPDQLGRLTVADINQFFFSPMSGYII